MNDQETTLSHAPPHGASLAIEPRQHDPALTVSSVPSRVACSVIVPCFNEAESIGHLSQHLQELIEVSLDEYDFEFVIVDDGSTDQTWKLLNDHFGQRDDFQLIRCPVNQGIAAAIQTGLNASHHDIACSIDSDCTYPPLLLLKLIPLLNEQVTMVTGSPYHPLGTVNNVPAWRIWLSQCASSLYRRLLKTPLTCYTCAFRVYRRSRVDSIELENPGFTGIAEMLWKVIAQGDTVVEYPATLSPRQFGQSKMRTLAVTWGHLWLMGRILKSKSFPRKPFRRKSSSPPSPRSSPP